MGVARLLIAALALLALAACSVRRERGEDFEDWSHPTKDQLELRNDQAECERFFGSSSREQRNCLTAKGWKRRAS